MNDPKNIIIRPSSSLRITNFVIVFPPFAYYSRSDAVLRVIMRITCIIIDVKNGYMNRVKHVDGIESSTKSRLHCPSEYFHSRKASCINKHVFCKWQYIGPTKNVPKRHAFCGTQSQFAALTYNSLRNYDKPFRRGNPWGKVAAPLCVRRRIS